jgi:hypothetical protein
MGASDLPEDFHLFLKESPCSEQFYHDRSTQQKGKHYEKANPDRRLCGHHRYSAREPGRCRAGLERNRCANKRFQWSRSVFKSSLSPTSFSKPLV